MKRSRHERAGLLTEAILSTFALATRDLAAFSDTPGLPARGASDTALGFAARDPALRDATLALDGVRVAIDDPFV
jgi:hypothetical protein